MALPHLNLNLLQSLRALLDEANVTRAAQRLHITQSAMSKNLAQLREALQDPLLVRSAQGMTLTPRARRIKPELDRLLDELTALVAPEQFTPATCRQRFRIAATDYVAQHLLPRALQNITQQAPELKIQIGIWDQQSARALQEGRLDLATTIVDQMPAGIYQRKIGDDSFVGLMRPGHPLGGRFSSPEDYIAFPHVVITSGGDKIQAIDRALATHGLVRDIRLEVPFYASAVEFVARTDLLLALPAHIAQHLGRQHNLSICDLPFDVPRFEYSVLWHERQHRSPAHRWFRQRLHEELSQGMLT